MKRLRAAQEAIDYAKTQFPNGAGNQATALSDSRFNSYFRMQATRDDSTFNLPPKVLEIAAENDSAFTAYQAARAELSGGGNCGEHAAVAYEYLRRNYPDEYIQLSAKDGLDHAFVIIGNPESDAESDLVVADPWPTVAEPVLWEDHFAYTSKKSKIQNHASSQHDNRDYKKEMFDAGLSLSANGVSKTEQSLTDAQTEDEINKAKNNHWMWNHPDAAASGKEYDYTTNSRSSIGSDPLSTTTSGPDSAGITTTIVPP